MTQPKTLPHAFSLAPLRNHFANTPNPTSANALIDLPGDEFLDTEEEITVVAAALWVMCVEYDRLDEEDVPADIEGMRRWIINRRGPVIGKLANKVQPPFPPFAIDQMLKDIGAMMEEMLAKTLAPSGAPLAQKK